MPRTNRIVAIGCPHHITHRGNNKQPVFLDDNDYIFFLNTFEKYKNTYDLKVYSYSLIPNHVHIKGIPFHRDSMSKTFNLTQMVYARYFNRKYEKLGHLWQNRFFSCPLGESHTYNVTKYIDNNPVRHGLVAVAENWKWSSARDHLGISKGIISLEPIDTLLDIDNWKAFLKTDLSKNEIKDITNCVLTGKPLGDEKFVNSLEKLLGISLAKRSRGRPFSDK